MKLLTISILCVPAMFPLMAQDQTPGSAWLPLARQAQAQLKEARFAEAAESAKQALQAAKHYGPSDSRVASTHHLLGLIYRDWGRCPEARTNYVHAIAIWKRQSEPNPRYLFNSITNLIGVLCECDEFEAAEKAYRTYASDLERDRSDSMDDARLLSLRAVLARVRKDYPRAETLFHQSIELMEKSPKAKPVDIEAERNNLAVIFDKEGRYAESLAASERTLAFFEQNAPRHPSLVASLNNAACSLASLGRKDESERMFERALKAAADLYGEDNRLSAKIMLSYAQVLHSNKESPAAEAWHKKGTEAFRRSLARDHGTVDVEDLKVIGK
jgi:tetratricopeptide (TPR) repeat protein